ncbi:hypothetical protein VN0495_14870 [Helicobacter pylori]|nr:hypothetical protein VN0495_14870 [Helicobacter pylori]
MWNEKNLKIMPAILFLFCILEIFELVLIINDMNQTEKLESRLKKDLEMLKTVNNLTSKTLECTQQETLYKNR